MEIKRQRAFLYVSSAVIGVLTLFMVAPYLSYIVAGLLFAFITMPSQRFLERRIGSGVSAFIVIFMTLVAALLPFTMLAGVAGDDAADMVSGFDSSDGLKAIEPVEEIIADYTGQKLDLESKAGELIKKIASYLPTGLSSAADILTELAIGVSLMLFTQFYALKDGRSFIAWTKQFDFMDDDRQEMLYSSTSNSVWAVVKGHISMAIAQGLLAGFGLYLFGVENVLFWTLMMIVLGFIPMIGAALVWFPAAIYLIISGEITAGASLIVYGAVVVGGADNFLRPMLVDDDADIHPFFIIIGLIGGVTLFGPVGLFVGPVIFGILKNLLNMLKEEH